MHRLLLLTALLLLLPGGCGGDDDDQGRTVTAKPGATLAVAADEYSFDPERVVLTGAGELTVELENVGVLAHNLRVFDGGEEIGGTPTFTGGKTLSGTVTVAPGEYQLVCTVGDHAELGMTGKLSVR